MNIKNIFKISFGAAALVATQISCIQDDNWDAPEITCTNKWDAPTKTMAEVVAMARVLPTIYTDATPTQIPVDDPNVAGDEVIFDAYVVSSDAGGNFYKTISIQDKPENPTVGLSIGINKSMNYIDFPVGAHIRIKANGMVIGKSYNTIQLGVKDPNYPIGRVPESIIGRYLSGVCNGNGLEIVDIVPTVVTISQLVGTATGDKYLNTLVKVKNAQFEDGAIGLRLMNTDASGAFIDTDRKIEDGSGSTASIRTDGFFKASSYVIPNKKGEITFVASKYNANYQSIIRGTSDINFTETRVDASPPLGGSTISYLGAFTENFESYAAGVSTFPKYVNDASVGGKYWINTSFSSNKYIQMTSYAGSASTNNKTYFIVPVLLTGSTKFSFKTKDGYYLGDVLKVYYTTTYTPGAEVDTTKLVDITSSFTISKNNTTGYGTNFINSGVYTFPSATTGNGYIFFSYEGTSTITTTMQIDDIVVTQ